MSGAKYVFITGGVVSSLGKGIVASSLGLLLRDRGYAVTIQKLDPYLNVDPGTMSPYQHGEVFVTSDGAETDLDLGHYERFIDRDLYRINNVTAGQIYSAVLDKERRGEYLGGTVQMVPHVSNQIKEKIFEASSRTESKVVIVEVGGTVGDIESLIFLESIRQIRQDLGDEDVAYVHVTLIPSLSSTGELKTKPTQHSVEFLRSRGIIPDILACRSQHPMPSELRNKLSMFTGVSRDAVIECQDVESIYEVPLRLEEQNLCDLVTDKLCVPRKESDLRGWKQLVSQIKAPKPVVRVALVGKYVKLGDAYISVVEALGHAALECGVQVEMVWVYSDEEVGALLEDVEGILVPGGFGERGIEGKIAAIRHAREQKVPFLGLCLGMQCAVVEYARNVAGMEDAHSSEFDREAARPVIHYLPGQAEETHMGGTMRLGSYECKLMESSLAHEAYGEQSVFERHRHRYEVNNDYVAQLTERGLICSGLSPDGKFVEIVELPSDVHPFFLGTQFHPEYRSRPRSPHPLFTAFVRRCIGRHPRSTVTC